MKKRVRVLPGRLLEGTAPPPPPEAPPAPTDLVSLLLVGDSKSGKTSLVESFVSHTSCRSDPYSFSADDDVKFKNNSRSSWSVAYAKKDFSFIDSKDSLQSLRVQIWDTSGLNYNAETQASNNDWNTIWKKASAVLLVLPMREESVPRIAHWKDWIDRQVEPRPIALVLHQGDRWLQPQSQSQSSMGNSMDWIQMVKRVAQVCHELGFQSWHITSSCLQDEALGNSIDRAFREILGQHKRRRRKPRPSAPSVTSTVSTDPTNTTPTKLITPPKGKKISRVVSPLT